MAEPSLIRTLTLGALLGLCVAAPQVRADDFPQMKINFIDTSEAPKIRIWASIAKRNFRAPSDKDIQELTIYRKPDGAAAEEFFRIDKDHAVLPPRNLPEEEKVDFDKKIGAEYLFAAESKESQAIVVLVPGFQDPEYRNGSLGERSRNGAGLFFKKLGKNNEMNVIWYNDFLYSYVFTAGRETSLTKLDAELEKCRKWETELLQYRGLSEEELAEALGPPSDRARENEALCGLSKEYSEFGKYLERMPYDGFWPQLFGLKQRICANPQHAMKRTGLGGSEPEQRMNAFETALEMLAKHPDPGIPKVMVLTGDGRDGYIDALSDCRAKYTTECGGLESANNAAGRDRLTSCVNGKLEADIKFEQGVFLEKLPTWIALAKAANIRIYSVVHPTAEPHTKERMEVLSWRTGGTVRVAEDANQVGDHYDALISELNNQLIITFNDDKVVPGSEVSYQVKATGLLGPVDSKADATTDPFTALVPDKVEMPWHTSALSWVNAKIGKKGMMGVLIGIGLLFLFIFMKIAMRLFNQGKAAGMKMGKGKLDAVAKAKAKAIEKAKKAKEAQKKALAKATRK